MLIIKGENKMSFLQIMGNFSPQAFSMLGAPFKQPCKIHLKRYSETPKLKKISYFSKQTENPYSEETRIL